MTSRLALGLRARLEQSRKRFTALHLRIATFDFRVKISAFRLRLEKRSADLGVRAERLLRTKRERFERLVSPTPGTQPPKSPRTRLRHRHRRRRQPPTRRRPSKRRRRGRHPTPPRPLDYGSKERRKLNGLSIDVFAMADRRERHERARVINFVDYSVGACSNCASRLLGLSISCIRAVEAFSPSRINVAFDKLDTTEKG